MTGPASIDLRHAPVLGVLWMTAAALCFSIAIGFVRHLSDTYTTFEIAFFRQVLGLVLASLWVWRAGFDYGQFSRRGQAPCDHLYGHIWDCHAVDPPILVFVGQFDLVYANGEPFSLIYPDRDLITLTCVAGVDAIPEANLVS